MASDLDLDAIRARLAAATPGPWTLPYDDGALAGPDGDSLLGLDVDGMAIVWSRADADLIAHAPADLAALLAEVERLRARAALAAENLRGNADEVFAMPDAEIRALMHDIADDLEDDDV